MAEKLHMAPRSYLDLEHGKYCFSLTSLVLFASLLSDEQLLQLFHDFRGLVEQAEQEAENELD